VVRVPGRMATGSGLLAGYGLQHWIKRVAAVILSRGSALGGVVLEPNWR
jgi:hypothetical protein